MPEYDIHVATEGSGDLELARELEKIGLIHDNLKSRGVTFAQGRRMSSCPLIGLHMTKKYETPSDINSDMTYVKKILEKHGAVGYAHAEVTSADVTVQNDLPYIALPFPVQRFDASIRPEDKRWDLHLSIPKSRLPQGLEEQLSNENSGMYYIELDKKRPWGEETFRVYTIQGINEPALGRKLHQVLYDWLEESRVPYAEMKMETYIGMFRVGDPKIVPPTIDRIISKTDLS